MFREVNLLLSETLLALGVSEALQAIRASKVATDAEFLRPVLDRACVAALVVNQYLKTGDCQDSSYVQNVELEELSQAKLQELVEAEKRRAALLASPERDQLLKSLSPAQGLEVRLFEQRFLNDRLSELLAAMPLLPIEKPEHLMSIAKIKEESMSVLQMTTSEDIDKAKEEFEQRKLALVQLHAALKKGVTHLKSHQRKVDNDQKSLQKKRVKEEQRRSQQVKKEKEQEDNMEKKKVHASVQGILFSASLFACQDLSRLSAEERTSRVWTMQHDVMDAVRLRSMDKWERSFTSAELSKRELSGRSPIKGDGPLFPLMRDFLKGQHAFLANITSMELVGYLHGWHAILVPEPHQRVTFLGKGQLRMACFQKALVEAKVGSSVASECVKFLQGIDDDAIADLQGVLMHAKADTKSNCFSIPPGYFCIVAVPAACVLGLVGVVGGVA